MTSFFRWFSQLFSDMLYLRHQKYSTIKLYSVLKSYTTISLKMLFKCTQQPKKHIVHMCNFHVSTYRYSTLFYLFREIFIRGEYNFHNVTTRPIIYDVGANTGVATLFFKWKYPDSIIHSFEPDPATFAILKENIKRNKLEDVYLHNIAIGNKNETVVFFTDTEDVGSLRMGVEKTRANGKEITVSMKKLSSFIKKTNTPILVKMDIEGSETDSIQELAKSRALKKMTC